MGILIKKSCEKKNRVTILVEGLVNLCLIYMLVADVDFVLFAQKPSMSATDDLITGESVRR